jgi:hypothetical protein
VAVATTESLITNKDRPEAVTDDVDGAVLTGAATVPVPGSPSAAADVTGTNATAATTAAANAARRDARNTVDLPARWSYRLLT